MERLVRALVLLALVFGVWATDSAIAKPVAEQRVTQLLSQLPPGIADTGVCGRAQRHGCDIKVTPDSRHVLFAMSGGPLLQWQVGESRVVSAGPLGTGEGDHCYPYSGPCSYEQTADGRTVVFETPSRLVAEDGARGTDVYIRSPQGLRLISTAGPANGEYSYRAYFSFVSPDANRVLYAFDTFGDPVPWLYEWTSAASVHRFPSESNPAADVQIVKRLSADGQHVLFTTTSALVPEDDDNCAGSSRSSQNQGCVDIYERMLDGRIKLISTPASSDSVDASFVSASANADQIFFTTSTPPLNWWDPAATVELYARIGDTTTLVGRRVSARGQVLVSEDGSKAFFTTDESLVPEDQDGSMVYDPIPDTFVFKLDPDIYAWSNGRYSLVSTGPLDHNGRLDPRLQQVSPDGRYMYFSTTEALLPEDTNTTTDVYVRDTVNGVTSLAPRQTSQPPPEVPGEVVGASRDGRRVFFTTDQALAAQDTDRCVAYDGNVHGCQDIYERDLATGATTLISTGPSDPQGSCTPDGPRCPSFIGVSADGNRVFFETDLSLASNDTDGGLNDIYVSKIAQPGCQPKSHGKSPQKC